MIISALQVADLFQISVDSVRRKNSQGRFEGAAYKIGGKLLLDRIRLYESAFAKGI